ncbi:unnamed protein product [Dimorphilus gyrociliatus]|uniref:Uncharacterized protein n=1 Tax=Dimorphilus gyrociliatus TaxID=2664684 RepID=A0A7I8WFB8_9ANNE|nr:unnamed protein product [Dimorphilus gyrociliatus]
MDISDPVLEKDCSLYRYSKNYKGIRTGNTISIKFLKRHFRAFKVKIYKNIEFDSILGEKQARNVYKNQIFEIDYGNLEGKFCISNSDWQIPFRGYSTNKKYRWRLQQQIIEANRAKWLNDESYTVSFIDNIIDDHHIDESTAIREKVALYCN